jgi:peptidoglycan/LPS O-acetylase OafA/YrhL
MTHAASRNERIEAWDALRGIAIVSVVVIHAAGPLAADTYRDYVVGGVARLGVPLFLLLSGLLAGLRATPRDRFASYFWRFLRLHIVYALAYTLFSMAWRGDEIGTAKELLVRFAGGGFPGQYYFLILLQVYFAAAFLVPRKLWARTGTVIACAGLVALGIVFCHEVREGAFLAGLPREAKRALASQMPAWLWFYDFALGAWVGERMRRGTIRTPPPLLTGLLVAGALVIVTVGLPLPGDAADVKIYAYLRPRIYVALTLLAFALPGLAKLRFGRGLRMLGRDSFGVFVLNPAVLAVLFGIILEPDGPALSLVFATLALAICLPIARQMRQHTPWLYP